MRRIGPPVQGLAAELRHDVELLTEFDHKIEAAHSVLIEAVREGRMTAWGRRAYGWGEPNVSAEHEAISATLFLGPRTIEFTDWLVYDKTRPPKEWAGYQGPYFDLIRFRAAEAMRLWPSPEDTAAMSGQGQSDGLAAARAWMDKHTANLKVLPKREVMLADCRKATGCNYRQALAAWGALPPERKRKPRQTDRKLSKAAAR
jgi:hypothetical protein